MAAQQFPTLTPQQYLEVERAADFKSEFYGGEMFAMSGGSLPHSLIATNFGAEGPLSRAGERPSGACN